MKHSEYSVVIIGSGAAGLFAALKISSQINLPDGILLITKSSLGESNSRYAQGGIVGVMNENKSDSVESHVADTIKAGAGLNDKNVVKYISELSDTVIKDLISCGVKFDCDNAGNINYTLEAAHSHKRILHAGGDSTGRAIVEALSLKVKEDSNITILEDTMAVELLINSNHESKGVIIYNSLTGEHEIVYSSAVVIATGGVGQVYRYTTNPDGATGDGLDLAYNAGAVIQDMEFIQFHPTALALSPNSKERFLISEAVRGEGAKLVDSSGNEFMSKYHDQRELAPRDIVTRAIYTEMQNSHTSNMYLNASIIGKNKLQSRFPTILNKCISNGIDISSSPIPIAPAAHYTMGGIKTTVQGKTSIPGLYAIGEAASTGLHGANRLASNSLLECVVCAYELADYLSFANLETPKIIDAAIMHTIEIYSKPLSDIQYNISELKQRLKDLMWNNAGIIRNGKDLLYAKEEIDKMKLEFFRNRKCADKQEYEYRNMLTAASLIVESAINRTESIGAHSRKDSTGESILPQHSRVVKNSQTENLEYVK